MLKTANDVQVGDVVLYKAFSGELVKVLVDEVSQNIKNGRAGFGGSLFDAPSMFVWGYCEQIACFVSHANEVN